MTITKPASSQPVKYRFSPWRMLILVGVISTAIGIGFGLALRIYQPENGGASLINTEQSFPPRRNWPVSEPSI
jgi:serine/threonine-protein kinase